MKISFTAADFSDADYVRLYLKWQNDGAIKHLFRFFESSEDLKEPLTEKHLQERKRGLKGTREERYVICVDGVQVGQVTVMMDPFMLFDKTPRSAFLGIFIGEDFARGKGVGTAAMNFAEERALAMGAIRMELGVFEHNSVAFQMYKKLGYVEIGRNRDFTYWDGRMWDDVRLEKRFYTGHVFSENLNNIK